MKNITITIDLRSLGLGALGMLCIGLLSNFNNADQPRENAVDEVRRYQAVSGESGLVILDTKTGQYIMPKNSISRPIWTKGDFSTTYSESRPN